MRIVIVTLLLLLAACVDKEAQAQQRAAADKAFMAAEAQARTQQDAADAARALQTATLGCDSGQPASCIALGKLAQQPTQADAA